MEYKTNSSSDERSNLELFKERFKARFKAKFKERFKDKFEERFKKNFNRVCRCAIERKKQAAGALTL